MSDRTVHWLIYTFLLGLVPAIARLVVWAASDHGVEPISIGDMVAFGLVMHSSNINEVSRIHYRDSKWKTVHNGTSILFIFLYGLIMFAAISPPSNINLGNVLNISLFLGVASLALGVSVLFRSEYLKNAYNE